MFSQAELDNAELIKELAECRSKQSEKRTERSGSLERMKMQNTIKAQATRIEKLERAVKTLAEKVKNK